MDPKRPNAPVSPSSEPVRPEDFKVTLSLEGLPSNDGEVRLTDMISELQTLSSLLVGLDRAVSPDHKLSTDYTISDLRRTNPTEVEITGTPKPDAPDVRPMVFGEPFHAANKISQGETTGFDFEVLESLRALARPVGRRLRSATLSMNGASVELTKALREKIDALLLPRHSEPGFIQGRLEAANVHGSVNTCRLYPRCGPKRVSGTFSEDLQESVGAALGRDIVASGILTYRADEQYPHAVVIQSLRMLPPIGDEGLPSFADLPSQVGGFSDGLDTETWLARRRAENRDELMALLGVH